MDFTLLGVTMDCGLSNPAVATAQLLCALLFGAWMARVPVRAL
jgi:hypothetical protein